MVSSEDDGCI